ncbi:cobalamin biosynthesis protein [Deinococcus sp. YIM 77859]|uniref:cobalamin biosynthesis protein n=1 Tax=Deinococcus sp. YIM 77859 TaxID=1540221 RepID=UPI0005555527|nr:cobalamin biosynthesis protein [Deinococcus sp. YIM 77859]
MTALAVWPVRREAEALGLRLSRALEAPLHRPWESAERQQEQFRRRYRDARAWVLIGAAGIAVRLLAGLPADKRVDPAVVVLDDAARFAVALLGGHEGGANALAYAVARHTGAVPVITTATEAARPLTLGLGCRRGVSEAQVTAAVTAALGERSLTEVREVATVDLKANEPGLLAFCERHRLPLRSFAAADLRERPFLTRASAWVQQQVGLGGVCEPCALMASPRGRLLVPKTALNGVTVAVVEDSPGGWA